MAEAGRNAGAHHTAFLDEAGKEVLVKRYLDLEFVDDVTELLCQRCRRVVIHHYVANCGHLFCRNCQRILSNDEGWRCPECREYITHIERQEMKVERRVNELMLHCPNHKYGCDIVDSLQHIPEHLKMCLETRDANLPALLDENNSKSNILIRISEMKKVLNEMGDRMLELRASEESRRQQINSKLGDMENIVKGSALMTVKLQAELANNSSRLIDLDREMKEVTVRLSELEMQQNQINDSFKHRSEAFENNPRNYSQINMDEMEQNIKTNLAKDFSRHINEMALRINSLSRELKSKSAEITSQQSAIKTHLTKKCHEVDNNRRRDFKMKLDAMEQTMKTNSVHDYEQIKGYINALGKNVNQLSIGLDIKSAENASQLSAIEARLTEKFEELDKNRRKDFQMRLDQLSTEINELRRFMNETRRTNANTSKNDVRDNKGLTMPRVPQPPRKPMLTNGHGISEFNILLLGPIGSGKSTFVNSLVNYLKYRTFDEAEAGATQCLIPGSFKSRTSSRDWKTVAFGEPSDNEETGQLGRHSLALRSKTIACKSYIFQNNQCVIRVIDSPGIYSYQAGQTPSNLTNILDAIRKYRQLHTIMVVMNISDGFMFSKWSVEDALSRLQQSAVANVTWLFTHSNGPIAENTSVTIRKMLNDIERKRKDETRMPLNKSNSYHLDNRAFRHLILKSNGFRDGAKGMRTTWSHSVNECQRMLDYVIHGPDGNGIPPLPIDDIFRL